MTKQDDILLELNGAYCTLLFFLVRNVLWIHYKQARVASWVQVGRGSLPDTRPYFVFLNQNFKTSSKFIRDIYQHTYE